MSKEYYSHDYNSTTTSSNSSGLDHKESFRTGNTSSYVGDDSKHSQTSSSSSYHHQHSKSDIPSSSSYLDSKAEEKCSYTSSDRSSTTGGGGDSKDNEIPKAYLSLSGVIMECNDSFAHICEKTSRFLINTNITSLAKFDTPAALLEAAYKLDHLGESGNSMESWKAKLAIGDTNESVISDGAPLSATTEPIMDNEDGYMIIVTRSKNKPHLLEATLKSLSSMESNPNGSLKRHRWHSMSQDLNPAPSLGNLNRDSFVSFYGNTSLLPVTTPTHHVNTNTTNSSANSSSHTSPVGPHMMPTSSSASFSFPTRQSIDGSGNKGFLSSSSYCPSSMTGIAGSTSPVHTHSPVPTMAPLSETHATSTSSLHGAVEGVTTNVSLAAEPKNLKVLIVEDSPTSLKLMARMITRLGHQVSTATNGKTALELLQQESYDIVLMDINMPLMNGLQASHEFRKLEQQNRASSGGHKPYQKIIAMSGDISNTLFTEVTNAGFDAFIPKPLTEERFHEVLHMPPSNGCK